MTDSVAALAILSDIAGPAREEALADFYGRWKDDPLVIDKWLAIQATSALPDTLWRIEELLRHPAFSMRNPNKVRALIGALGLSAFAVGLIEGLAEATEIGRASCRERVCQYV